MGPAPIQHIETHMGTFEVTTEGKVLPLLLAAFYKQAEKVIKAPFTIQNYVQNDLAKEWNIKLLFQNGEETTLQIPYQDINDEISLSKKRKVQKSFAESIGLHVPTHEDGYTRAITHFFMNHNIKPSTISPKSKWNKSRSHIVVDKGLIHITKGFSRIEAIFRRIFQPNLMKAWEHQNRRAITTYLTFLENEIGAEKIKQIQATYGFDLVTMHQNGQHLEPKHIYFFNIGMNNIEMSDVKSLKSRMQTFLDEHEGSEKLHTILSWGKLPFTLRETRAILKELGEEGTVEDLKTYFSFGAPRLTHLVKLLETPQEAWEKIYTGRKFKTKIKGGYNEEVTDRRTFRPWIDQQELLQVFNEMKDPFPGQKVERKKLDHYFFEMITKVVVKKHLMRNQSDNHWRVGALIPSPYKDKEGNTVYYRVDQGVDTGHGKLWYVFKPASKGYDPSLPVIRAPRDTARDHYAQRGGPTTTRDLARNAGYLYSSTSQEEDAAFFKEFTLPVWMGHFAITMKASKKDPKNLKPHLKELHNALQGEIKKRILENRMGKAKGEEALIELNQIYSLFNSSNKSKQLRFAKLYFATIFHTAPYDMEDCYRLRRLMKGKAPRPLATIGNSLGGFDAQNDLVRNTLAVNRIPITDLQLYTHSTLKIDQKEDHLFTNFILGNKELLLALGVKLTIRHVTEFEDPVSLATQGTFLGRMLQSAADEDRAKGRPFPVAVSLGVFRPNPHSRHPEIRELKTHCRRIERAEKGVDYVFLQDYRSIAAYDAFGRNFKIRGRRIEAWRGTAHKLNLQDFSDHIWRAWRHLLGTTHRIPRQFANHKLTVKYRPNGTSQFQFIPISPTIYPDNLNYKTISVLN